MVTSRPATSRISLAAGILERQYLKTGRLRSRGHLSPAQSDRAVGGESPPPPRLLGSADRCCQLHLDVVRVAEWQHVDAESVQSLDLAVRHPSLVEEAHSLLQLVTAANAEAEVVEADPILVEAIALRRHRP